MKRTLPAYCYLRKRSGGHTSARTVPIYTAQVRQIERAKQAQEKRQK